MERPIKRRRPQRRAVAIVPRVRAAVVERPAVRRAVVVPSRAVAIASPATALQPLGFVTDPYPDYARVLTPEGGILIVFKDLDLRLRHTVWRLWAWSVSTSLEAWYLFTSSPVQATWLNVVLFVAMAIVNWFIVAKPVEVYRQIEIRLDCVIVDGADVFWRHSMELWPALRPDTVGNQVLCGVYGTRFVEFLTVRRFDELDRMPEIFASHLAAALQQLWTMTPV